MKHFWIVLKVFHDEAWDYQALFKNEADANSYISKLADKSLRLQQEPVLGLYVYPNKIFVVSRVNKSLDLSDFIGLYASYDEGKRAVDLKFKNTQPAILAVDAPQ